MDDGPRMLRWQRRALGWALVVGHGGRKMEEQEQIKAKEEGSKIGVFSSLKTIGAPIYNNRRGSQSVGWLQSKGRWRVWRCVAVIAPEIEEVKLLDEMGRSMEEVDRTPHQRNHHEESQKVKGETVLTYQLHYSRNTHFTPLEDEWLHGEESVTILWKNAESCFDQTISEQKSCSSKIGGHVLTQAFACWSNPWSKLLS